MIDRSDASRFDETQAGREPIVLSGLHHRASTSNKVREGGKGDDDRHCNQNSSVYHPLTLKPQRHDEVLWRARVCDHWKKNSAANSH